MHERNIYKNPPDFAKLAKRHEFLVPFLTVDARGIPRINFKDKNALRALSRALLLDDFGLDVQIPENVLVPTIPLRLNYILWVEDLLTIASQSTNGSISPIRGIDIGTGATAVYALLGARKNNWRMTGTEIHPEHVKIAQVNVEANKLTDFVTIVPAKKSLIFGDLLGQVDDGYFSFTMCNPPFFSSDEETDSVNKGRFSPDDKPLRPPPSAAKTGQSTELVADGGELQFVQSMVKESLQCPSKVLIYTTMLGIKRHMKQLISELRNHKVINYTTTEFVQGKTTRWGLAWSFVINLLPSNPDLVANFPNFSPVVNFESLIHSYLAELNPHILRWLPSSSENVDVEQPVLELIATENTWSNQRRKRREMERLKAQGCFNKEVDVHDGPSPSKAMKLQDGLPATTSTSVDTETDKPLLIHCLFDFLREEDGNAKLIMRFRDGNLGKEGMNQILQFIKNKYSKDSTDPGSIVFQMSL